MKPRFFYFLLKIFFLVFYISIDAMADNPYSLMEENQQLESELKLAKKPQIYLIFDLKDKKIFIKARGIILKELKIEDIRLWGQLTDITPHSLQQKSILFEPYREKIKPKKAGETKEKTSFEIRALELDDMPASFRFGLNESIIISIRPKASGVISTISNTLHRTSWYLSRPILTLWNHLRKKPFCAIYITLQKEDARALYWVFAEGTESIIFGP